MNQQTIEIITGLYRLPGIRGVNAYIWHPRPDQRADNEPLLFDCGWPWSGARLVAGLEALSCRPEDTRAIAITHDDIDHVGRLASLQAVSGAEVFAHELEAQRMAQNTWREPPGNNRPINLVTGIADRIYAHWPQHPVRVSHPLRDGDELPGGWIAVHTPGHTPGHMSYFHPHLPYLPGSSQLPGRWETRGSNDLSVLIAGDAIGSTRSGQLRFPMRIYTEDSAAAARSIRKLADLKPDIICPGHGPVLYNVAKALQEFAESL